MKYKQTNLVSVHSNMIFIASFVFF